MFGDSVVFQLVYLSTMANVTPDLSAQKLGKTVQTSTEAMHKALEDCPTDGVLKDFLNSSKTNMFDLKVQGDSFSNCGDNASSSSENIESDNEVLRSQNIRKSMSLGNGLDLQGRDNPSGSNSEEEIDQVFSSDGSNGQDALIKYQECRRSDSVVLSSDMVNNGSVFSTGEPQRYEKEINENSDIHFSGDCCTPRTPPAIIVRSNSLPNIGSSGNSISMYLIRRARSSNDLNVLDSRLNKTLVMNKPETHEIQGQERDDHSPLNSEKNTGENQADDTYDTYNYVGSAKDWIIPIMDDMNANETLERGPESTVCRFEEDHREDFKIKMIEDWVMDLQHCGSRPIEEERNEGSDINNDQEQSGVDTFPSNVTMTRFEGGKVIPGTDVVKNYLSSLCAAATAAHLANHGLVVIPFLSAFVSLRALNLSGNAIVRITAGALPRGLHVLNLSKNSISTIEGLRELTRLRVLDLSYNRIVRIGHGLASCSALKELYLAGNKISEVEGLHRLLKLNVLDLRFNKISTTKCLGQLAANYNSLQAISLEGNAAQKNVGDEQLKKYLLGLLPNIVYLNRQSIKSGKDVTDRSTRLVIGSHQMERGGRSELKSLRKASHGVSHKSSNSSVRGRKSQPVGTVKASRGRHGRLPPSGTTKPTSIRANFYDVNMSVLRSDFSMRRSRSEGQLGTFDP